jgi:subtilisin family serine protease
MKKWFVLLGSLFVATGCGTQSSTESATEVSSNRSLINTSSNFSSTRFWVHIKDQPANPWNTRTGKAMTWRALSRQNDVTLVGSDASSSRPTDGTTNAYSGDASITKSLPVLCLNVNNTPKPSNITTTFYSGWSSGRILLSNSIRGSLLTSLAVANKVCADQFGTGWRMAAFHDGVHNGSGGGWGFYAISSFLTLSPNQVARGEQVTATLFGLDPDTATLTLDGAAVTIDSKNANKWTFKTSKAADGGMKDVFVRSGDRSTTEPLLVYGAASEDEQGNLIQELVVSIDPGQDFQDILARLTKLELTYVENSLQSLTDVGEPSKQGPCGRSTIRVRTNGKPLGASIESLLNQNEANATIFFDVNPVTYWVVKQAESQSESDPFASLISGNLNLQRPEIGVPEAHAAGFKGKGVSIAVIDTGVNLSWNFNTDPNVSSPSRLTRIALPGVFTDGDDDKARIAHGHGSPVASLAAGYFYGVAPEANVISVRACDSQNKCSAENVARAVCYVLARNPGNSLVYNLSLGGDSPNTALRAVLKHAVSQGALVAASAGNGADLARGINGFKNYPAAETINGLVSVGAAQLPNLAKQATMGVTSTAGVDVLTDPISVLNGKRLEPGFEAAIPFKTIDFSTPRNTEFGSLFLTFDLKSVKNVQRMHIYAPCLLGEDSSNEFVDQFDLEASTDGLTWNKITKFSYGSSSLSRPSCGGRYVFLTPELVVNGTRYLRLNITRGSRWLYNSGGIVEGKTLLGISEIEFLGVDWEPAPFTTRNSHVEIVAPGVGVASDSSYAGYRWAFTGTSFSTPQVAGALALWRSANPNATPAQIEADIRAKAKVLPYDTNAVGSGMLNVSNPRIP